MAAKSSQPLFVRLYMKSPAWAVVAALVAALIMTGVGYWMYYSASVACHTLRGSAQLAGTNDRLQKIAESAEQCGPGVDRLQMFYGDLLFIAGYSLLATVVLAAGWWRYEAVALRRVRSLVVLLPLAVAGLDVIEDFILLGILRTDSNLPYFLEGTELWSLTLFWVAWTKWIGVVALCIVAFMALAVWWSRRAVPFPATSDAGETTAESAAQSPQQRRQQAKSDALGDDSRYQALDVAPESSDHELACLPTAVGDVVGICLSGGGIRSTAFCLGVLAELEKPPGSAAAPPLSPSISVTDRARYVTAVSGGSWAATAWTLQKALDRKRNPVGAAKAAQRVFTGLSEGTGVAGYQRQKYLLNGSGSVNGGVAWALLCALVNIVLVGLLVFVVAWPLGMLMGTVAIRPDLRLRPSPEVTGMDTGPLVLPSIVFVIAGAVLLLMIGFVRKSIAQHWIIGAALLGLAAFSAAYLLWLPALFAYIASGKGLAVGLKQAAEVFTQSAIASSLFVSIGAGVWRVVKGPIIREVSGPVIRLLPKLFGVVLAAGIGGWAVVVMYGAARDYWFGDWPVFVAALAAVVAIYWTMGPNWPTLHNIFAKRLARSFDPVRRPMRSQQTAAGLRGWRRGRSVRRHAVGGAVATWRGLARVSKPESGAAVPELVLCCAQQRDGIASGGLRAETFTISPHWVRQGKRSIRHSQYAEAAAAVSAARLPGGFAFSGLRDVAPWMATTGAALSSAMGRQSVGTSNAMLATVNADLGVWLPNLIVIQEMWDRWIAGKHNKRADCPVCFYSKVLAESPHFADGRTRPRERRRAWRRLLPRPRFAYILKEIVGWYHTHDRFVFITDGGHWENLGLVELLRRKCNVIYCVDASGDRPGSFAALREALALESLELGELRINEDLDEQLRELKPRASGLPARMTTTLHAKRADDVPITIHYAKLQSSQEMPRELRLFAVADPTFPRYSTMRQFLTANQFEHLFNLGLFAGRQMTAPPS